MAESDLSVTLYWALFLRNLHRLYVVLCDRADGSARNIFGDVVSWCFLVARHFTSYPKRHFDAKDKFSPMACWVLRSVPVLDIVSPES